MTKIGILGLGGIAQKAYLPIAALHHQIDWVLLDRKAESIQRFANEYGFSSGGSGFSEWDALNLDAVMIHTPMYTHYELIEHFLNRGINVFVDKPLTLDLAQAKSLYNLAARNQVALMVGYNRRFCPLYIDLAGKQQKAFIQVTKNRIAEDQLPKDAVFDALSHPLDTALFIAGFPETLETSTHAIVDENGHLIRLQVTAQTPKLEIEATINLHAGANCETAYVETTRGTYQVNELSEFYTYAGTKTAVEKLSDWTPMLQVRGFEQMTDAFIQLAANHSTNPVSPSSSLLTQTLLQQAADSFETDTH